MSVPYYILYIIDIHWRGRKLYWSAIDIAWTVDRESATRFLNAELPANRHRWGICTEEV